MEKSEMELSAIESCVSSMVFDPQIKKERDREKDSLTKNQLILVEIGSIRRQRNVENAI